MLFNSLRVGHFLALRYLKGSNYGASVLIIFIMLLIFLNLTSIRGVLIGLPEGARTAYKNQYAGDVIIKTQPNKRYIEKSSQIEKLVENIDGYINHSSRYIGGGVVEANYKDSRKQTEIADKTSAQITGIIPSVESGVTNLPSYLAEGEYLFDDDYGKIMLSHRLLDRYTIGGIVGDESLANVYPGDKVRITIGDFQKEYTVKGILESKVGENSRRVFMVEGELRKLLGRFDYNVNEIAINISADTTPDKFRDSLKILDVSDYAVVQTADESQGQFLTDIQDTFAILGTVTGLTGIVVASITVFIVIFVFAISRQKQIGILKGIGISNLAIETSYVFLAVFYAVIGVGLGMILLYFYIKPYIDVHPINFPFSDGILVAPLIDTGIGVLAIFVSTVVAGYIPARLIVSKNTINSILGR